MFSNPLTASLAVSRVCSAYSLPALRKRRFIVFGVDSSEDIVRMAMRWGFVERERFAQYVDTVNG